MKKNFKFLGLLLALSGVVLASCGQKNDSTSSDSNVPSSNPTSDTTSASTSGSPTTLEKALEADYSNMTVQCVQSYDLGSGVEEEYFEELEYNDYTIIMPDEGDEDKTYLFYHDYQNQSYLYFEGDDTKDGAWLKNGLYDIDLSLRNTYFDWSYSKQYLHARDAVYQSGAYIISDDTVIAELNQTVFAFAWFNNIEYVMIFVTDGYISQITGLCSLENDDEYVIIKFTNIGTTTFTDSLLPPAPAASNIKTYYEFFGITPVEDKYITSLEVSVEGNPTHDDDYDIILEIEKTANVSVSYLPEDANKKDIKWHCSDESIIKIDADFTPGWRILTGLKAGTAEVYATSVNGNGETVTSNKIKVKVNPLGEQNKEGCVYDFSFINVANDNVIARNNVTDNNAPYEITANKAKIREITNDDGAFSKDTSVIYLDPLSTDFSKPTGSELLFNFDDQQVSSISLYYGLIFDNHKSYLSKLSEAKIMTSNDGETWDEIDILNELVNNISANNKKLMEYSFAPASMVKIFFKANSVGNSLHIAFDNIAFMADENCHMHGVVDVVAIESIEISAAKTSLKIGSSVTFGALINPSNATDKTVTWHSSNEAVLSIDNTGKATAIKDGTAKVYALSADELVKSNEIEITVLPATHMPESYEGVYKANVFVNGDDHEFTLNVTSVDNATMTVEGISYEFTVDSIDDNYYLLLGSNDEFIRIKYSDYSKKMDVFAQFGSYSLGNNYTNEGESFTPYVVATSIVVSSGATNNTLVVGQKTMISAKVLPSDAYYTELTREVSDNSIADFENDESIYLIAKSAGEVTVTYTNADGISGSITITVLPIVNVTAITIDAPTSIEVGESQEIKAVITPNNYNTSNLEWSSSNTKIAKVSKNSTTGKVTLEGKAVGECTITCKDTVTGIEGTLTITVTAPSAKIPAAMVGTWYAIEPDYEATFTFEFDILGNLNWQEDLMGSDYSFTLESISGNIYTFSSDDGEFVFSFDGSSLTLVSMNEPSTMFYATDLECYQ